MAGGTASVAVQELLEPDHGLVRAQYGGRFLPSGSAATRIKAKLDDCDRKLTQYRAALDVGADPATVAQCITQTEAERARYKAAQRATPQAPAKPMSPEKIAAVVRDLADLITVVRNAGHAGTLI